MPDKTVFFSLFKVCLVQWSVHFKWFQLKLSFVDILFLLNVFCWLSMCPPPRQPQQNPQMISKVSPQTISNSPISLPITNSMLCYTEGCDTRWAEIDFGCAQPLPQFDCQWKGDQIGLSIRLQHGGFGVGQWTCLRSAKTCWPMPIPAWLLWLP